MGTEESADPIRREVVAAAAALSMTGGLAAALFRSGWLDVETTTDAALAPPSTATAPVDQLVGVPDKVGTPPSLGGGVPSGASPPPESAERSADRATQRVLTPAERRLHVARRLTHGPTRGVLDHIESIGIDGFINEQLSPGFIDDRECDDRLRPLHRLDDSAADIVRRENTLLLGEDPGRALADLRAATLVRAVHSRRQLQEVMVGLWTDHLNIFADRGELRAEKVVDDRTVVRAHALGRFSDLLLASAHSPAMLRYLDNRTSRAEHPNENYARELLELHTLGVGNHTEADVRETARALTGWTVDDRFRFWFDTARHDAGPATVAGFTTRGRRGAAGEADGVELLEHLARHPSTARTVATRIARRFLSDAPSPEVVDRLASVYLANDTDIRPVLAALFRSDEFYASAGTKFCRPFEFVAAALRAAGADLDAGAIASGRPMDRLLHALGHRPFSWEAPDGYPDVAVAWRAPNDVVARWSFASLLAGGRIEGVAVDLARLHGPLDRASVGEVAERILTSVVVGGHAVGDRDALVLASGADDASTPIASLEPSAGALMVTVALASAGMQIR